MKSKILKTTGAALLVVVTLVWAAPYLFQGKINRLIKAQISKDFRARVSYSGTSISFFRHFPDISIGLDQVQITCLGEFQDDTLMLAKQFDMSCDLRSLFSGDSIRVHSINMTEPRFHLVLNRQGHGNWNIIKSVPEPFDHIDSAARPFNLDIQRYAIHNGYVDYHDPGRDLRVVINNLEHEGSGDFSSDTLTLNTKTTSDAVDFDYSGKIPYRVSVKTIIDMAFRVDKKTHTWSFNSDRVFLNDLVLHTEGFFERINDSSYNMNIRYKAPSTKFKNLLSMLPTVYQKDFKKMESGGQVNLNGFVKGRLDENHFPAYHTNLFVQNGYFKYSDLPAPVENIRFGLQIDNTDGSPDHLMVNMSEAHAEINHDTLDIHLLVKNLNTKPYLDFALLGKMDLSNFAKSFKMESGTHLEGILIANIHAKGEMQGMENHKKDLFDAGGDFSLENFSYKSDGLPGGLVLDHLAMEFNSKNVSVKEMKGVYLATRMDVSGKLNNLFDFAFRNQPLNASLDLKTDEMNLREWINNSKNGPAPAGINTVFVVPDNMDLTLHAEATRFHFDNLDMQNVAADLSVSDQTVKLHQVKANGLDGEIILDGTYSTLENKENPEFALNYDVKTLDVQKTFFAFNTIRRIMPVAKFISGNINAHMRMSGSLNNDMTTDLRTLYGEGQVELISGTMKEFDPMDKLSQSLDIIGLKDMPMNEVKADFSFRSGKVAVSPFLVQTGNIEMEIAGSHGFDQSVDYGISLKVPRSQLGNRGSNFVKHVVEQAAVKGIPVKLQDAVNMNVQVCGTINNPDVKEDMDAVVDHAATNLKKEIDDFVNAKLDSARQLLHNPSAFDKKPLYVQTSYKSKTVKTKKSSKHSKPAQKKTRHTGTTKKHKKKVKHYSV
ncbi:MAG TPA: AsmA-like C-terminal region-containing protein [Puia sp.]|nr:AsmA-like C-terminal region-containing protein [Puia sp.]